MLADVLVPIIGDVVPPAPPKAEDEGEVVATGERTERGVADGKGKLTLTLELLH